ncbi:hypothetical protein MAIT1_00665 [Magnetofaba australis IT-1]|uniref:Uncharacterized protein n=1 Tax=Magnetofaba australis IT-1 TaxID=1434232 RepID=A0A1Y2K0D7_9PROT|nr:hypothetical protein MAIT1_00665 [Magnetofaba australis IT-1]
MDGGDGHQRTIVNQRIKGKVYDSCATITAQSGQCLRDAGGACADYWPPTGRRRGLGAAPPAGVGSAHGVAVDLQGSLRAQPSISFSIPFLIFQFSQRTKAIGGAQRPRRCI